MIRATLTHPRFHNSTKHELTYLEIPKAASTSIKTHLQCDQLQPGHPRYDVFTVIREPIERFVSGYHELIRRDRFYGSIGDLISKILNEGFFDRHIEPQITFINNYYQNYDKLTVYTLPQYLENYDLPVLNKTDNKAILAHQELTFLRALYQDDIQMYESRT